MSKEMQTLFLKKESVKRDEDLENLIEKYIKQSEDLEMRENKILEQVELIQAAVSSLQAWNDSRKSSLTLPEFVPINVKQIEEETKKIKEETERIQLEIEQKQAENRSLEKEIERRRTLESEKEVRFAVEKKTEENPPVVENLQKQEILSRSKEKESKSEPPTVKKKLIQLEEMEKKLKKELNAGSEKFRKRTKSQKEKVSALEMETRMHKNLLENLRKQNKK